ncbi:MAG: hypothetical protein C4548_04675 [Desulfobacteraceae bacterium]|nr:MAG: hypothetical protein C4548_04675 [Desulfobacteraceae bacterium]
MIHFSHFYTFIRYLIMIQPGHMLKVRPFSIRGNRMSMEKATVAPIPNMFEMEDQLIYWLIGYA